MYLLAFAASLSFLLSVLLTIYYRGVAVRHKILDVPNERSSHKQPIPRGAGITFFISFNFVLALLIHQDILTMKYTFPVFLGGPVILLLGYWDDLSSIPATVRLTVHLMVSFFVFTLISSGFSQAVEISFLPNWPLLTTAFCILFIAWFINLYNFMDGCDGLATSVGMVGAGLISLLSYLSGHVDLATIYLILAYSLAGFLVFNWHPAKVFMGDAGAYYLGYVFGALALVSKMYYDSSLYIHLIILGLFVVDATWTLFRRALRGERVFNAHRQHAFQKLIKKGWGHARVTSLYVLITVLWLFPMAAFCMAYPTLGFTFLVVAYLPIFGFVLYMRAGEVD
jgi:Fuc2NAc and GlcNAc transferase